MGLFGPYVYKTKDDKKYWLHMRQRGKAKLFFFSKDPRDSLSSLPKGYEVVENPKTGLPFLKKSQGGGFFGKKKAEKTGENNTEGSDQS